jgi:hypothetical protein
MEPISQERHKWIEERLFILARTVQTMRRDGARHAIRYFGDNQAEAHAIMQKSVQDLQAERLSLMMERIAIEEYFQERNQQASEGNPNGS